MANTEESQVSASVWFILLERAKNLRDFELAAKAQRKLRELGVHVEFEPENLIRHREVTV